MEWIDRSVLEAVSWRLASELARRHPETTRLIRAHPGGGQYDCLWLMPTCGEKGSLQMNRNGTIQILERFDGGPARDLESIEWDEYLRADPHGFLHRLEVAAGLPTPRRVPAATPATLTYRVLAAIASMAVKSVHPIEIQLGFVDSSGDGGGPNPALSTFAAIPADLLRPREGDLFGEPGYRFWVVIRDGSAVLAMEQGEGLAWSTHHDVALSLMDVYADSGRSLMVTTLELLRIMEQV